MKIRYYIISSLITTFTHSMLATTCTNPTAQVICALAHAKQNVIEQIIALKEGDFKIITDDQKAYHNTFKLECGGDNLIIIRSRSFGFTLTTRSIEQGFIVAEEVDDYTKGMVTTDSEPGSVFLSITIMPREQLIRLIQKEHAARETVSQKK